MRALCAIAALMTSAYAVTLPWPYSWDTLPVFTFPGASPGFMDAAYLAANARYTMANIWGVNATCLDVSGETYPASCPEDRSWCQCTRPQVSLMVTLHVFPRIPLWLFVLSVWFVWLWLCVCGLCGCS